MSKEYSLRLIPNFIQYNDENNEEFNEIKKLYYDTGDTTLFNTISFIILDENKRIIESLTFPSYVLDDILNIVCDEREYSVVTYNLP